MCSAEPYTGSMCLKELHDWQGCLPERQNDSDVFIPSDVDQELREQQAQLLFTELQLLSPSEECEREFKFFWCLLLFGVCDGSGQRRLPSRDHCIQLHNNTCKLEEIGTELFLQNCDDLQFTSPACGKEDSSCIELRLKHLQYISTWLQRITPFPKYRCLGRM